MRIDAALDKAAFHLVAGIVTLQAALTERASRFLCEQKDSHDEEHLATTKFVNGMVEDTFICRREGCTHVRTEDYVGQRG